MPDPAFITPRGQEFLNDLPLILRDQQDFMGIMHANAKEWDRFYARLDSLVAEFLPTSATAVGLPLLEALVGTITDPMMTAEARRLILAAYFEKIRGGGEGTDWVNSITGLVGPGWTYSEHNPDDPTAQPPPNTILIRLPFPPSSDFYGRTTRFIRALTPAHLEIIVTTMGGFYLDGGRLDLDVL